MSKIQLLYKQMGNIGNPLFRRRLVIVFFIVVIMVVVNNYVNNYIAAPETEIFRVLSSGQFVMPSGGSAYDIYLRTHEQLSVKAKKQIITKVTPLLEESKIAFLEKYKSSKIIEKSEWETFKRVNSWLYDLRPQPRHKAYKLFAEGYLARLKEDYNKALSLNKQANDLSPDLSVVLNQIGVCIYKLKQNKAAAFEAVKWYERAIKADPDWITPYMNYCDTNNYLGEKETFEKSLEKVEFVINKFNPQNPEPYFIKADALAGLKQYCDAAKEHEYAIKLASGIGTDYDKIKRLYEEKLKIASSQCYESRHGLLY